jgi:hypothetical protein
MMRYERRTFAQNGARRKTLPMCSESCRTVPQKCAKLRTYFWRKIAAQNCVGMRNTPEMGL